MPNTLARSRESASTADNGDVGFGGWSRITGFAGRLRYARFLDPMREQLAGTHLMDLEWYLLSLLPLPHATP